jgi:hypothetical protein
MTPLTHHERALAYRVFDRLDANAQADMEADTTLAERDAARHRAAWFRRIREHLGDA